MRSGKLVSGEAAGLSVAKSTANVPGYEGSEQEKMRRR